MMSPEASDFAWILVVKPRCELPSACPSAPFCFGFEDSRFGQPVEHLPHAVPRPEAIRQAAHRTFSTLRGNGALRGSAGYPGPSVPVAEGEKHRERVRPILLDIFVVLGCGFQLGFEIYNHAGQD